MLDSTSMSKDLQKPADPEGDVTPQHWAVFGAGFTVYAVGFGLLGLNWPNLAPLIIVAGIVMMFGAFVFVAA